MARSVAKTIRELWGTRRACAYLKVTRQRLQQLAFEVKPDDPRPVPRGRLRAIRSSVGGDRAPLLFEPADVEAFASLVRPTGRPVVRRNPRRRVRPTAAAEPAAESAAEAS